MAVYDVFNGDADGILSLVQWRLVHPCDEAVRISGVKRDIELLNRVEAKAGDAITVLDISMRRNAADLQRLLAAGAHIFYVDHHNAGDVPLHANLMALIDTSPQTCTAVIMDEYLKGRYRPWAVTAAFGDNFDALARDKAKGLDLPLEKLKRLGELINYNGYGETIDDLHIHPARLFERLLPYETPMDCLEDSGSIFEALQDNFKADMTAVGTDLKANEHANGTIYVLPNTPASRRAYGALGNKLTQDNPSRAHAVLIEKCDHFMVSVRAPKSKREGADTLCLQFEGGGGRPAAAGINVLPKAELSRFETLFFETFNI